MLPRQTWTEERGTTGFVVTADPAGKLIKMRFWGHWDDDLAQLFERSMMAALRMIAATEKWYVLVDMSDYPPQKPSVQAAHASCMAFSKSRVRRAANLVANSISQMQIRRLSKESGLPEYSFYTNEAEALRWLYAEDPVAPAR